MQVFMDGSQGMGVGETVGIGKLLGTDVAAVGFWVLFVANGLG
jgi:hypothetical protein